MTYYEIHQLKNNSFFPEKEYFTRINHTAAIKTHNKITPINQHTGQKMTQLTFPLFINNIPQITYLLSQCYQQSAQLFRLFTELNGIQQEELLDYLFIEELKASYDLERLKMTRKEINQQLHLLKETPETPSTDELTNSYFYLMTNQMTNAHNLEALKVVTNTPCPSLYQALLKHYLLMDSHTVETTGLTARFNLTYDLIEELDITTALLVSQSILAHQSHYQKAFFSVANHENYGEATFFIDHLLTIITTTQRKLILKLEENKRLREAIRKQWPVELSSIPFAFEVFDVYFDHALYYPDELLSRKNIISFAHKDISSYMMRKIESSLLAHQFLEKRGEKPVTYRLNPTVIKSLKQEITDSY